MLITLSLELMSLMNSLTAAQGRWLHHEEVYMQSPLYNREYITRSISNRKSNCKLLKKTSHTHSELEDKQCEREAQKVLGVQWTPTDDHFVFDISQFCQLARELQPTRRNIVGLIARFYDPLGEISPVIVKLKILVDELCRVKLSWDEMFTGS